LTDSKKKTTVVPARPSRPQVKSQKYPTERDDGEGHLDVRIHLLKRMRQSERIGQEKRKVHNCFREKTKNYLFQGLSNRGI